MKLVVPSPVPMSPIDEPRWPITVEQVAKRWYCSVRWLKAWAKHHGIGRRTRKSISFDEAEYRRLSNAVGVYIRHTAIHEAGHAITGRVTMQSCGYVTIVQNENAGEAGYAICEDPFVTFDRWDRLGRFRGRDTMISVVRGRIMTYMAGREAEVVLLGSCHGGDDDDVWQVAMMFDSYPAIAAGAEPDEYPSRYDARLRTRTRWLVRHHRDAIERVAEMLLERGTLQPEEIERAIAAPIGAGSASSE